MPNINIIVGSNTTHSGTPAAASIVAFSFNTNNAVPQKAFIDSPPKNSYPSLPANNAPTAKKIRGSVITSGDSCILS